MPSHHELLGAIPHYTLMIGVALAVIAGCGQVVGVPATPEPLPSQPPSSGAWSTYTNQDFGFAIDYPPSLTIVERRGDDVASRLLNLRWLAESEADPLLRDRTPGQFALDVFDNPEELTAGAWLDAHGWPLGTGPEQATEIEVDGMRALEIETGRMLAPNRFIYLAANRVVIALMPIGPDSERILQSFRKILRR